VSEDYHTWLRYSAAGAEFVYTSLTPTRYRIPQDSAGSASRSREGGKHGFYATKCRVDALGFREAVMLARRREAIKEEDVDRLSIKFYLKEAETMGREQEIELARDCFRKARETNVNLTDELLKAMQLQNRPWAS
jgi:hypothetical protein